MSERPYLSVGKESSKIPVRISTRIIELFSEGLYSSPNKAVEELVCNAFDAGATNVHVITSPDLAAKDACIAIVDDGVSMNPDGLRQHWLIGVSNKRDLKKLPKNRKQIGKFGIGKLATYVLATCLTHICKVDGEFYSTTMDYSEIHKGQGGGIHAEKAVKLSLRKCGEKEVEEALPPIIQGGTKPGYEAIKLFGERAAPRWTVVIMSGLKRMGEEIQKGRLSWVLRTAMPLREDFRLYLDGEQQLSSKAEPGPRKTWVLGKDIEKLPGSASDDLEVTSFVSPGFTHPELGPITVGLTHPELGLITGYAEVYEDLLTKGKSAGIERSHGFFVYAYGRLINIADALFGMEALHHGTFARFRMVVHIDRLDKGLRSSRESVYEDSLVKSARRVLRGIFNHARSWIEEHDAKQAPGTRAISRIAQSPWSLTRRPLIGLLKSALDNEVEPHLLRYPTHLTKEQQKKFLKDIQTRAKTKEGLVVKSDLSEELSQEQGIALFDLETGTLHINALHPFVAAHRDDYNRNRETLSLIAMVEVLTEAYLYELGIRPSDVKNVMSRRDELLRHFAREMKRTAYMVAQDLEDASTDPHKLEKELVAAFYSMGFNAVPRGGKNEPDGEAEAPLGAGDDGKKRRYKISLEAKSRKQPGRVASKTVGIATIARHRDDCKCDHAVVVGPDFQTNQEGSSALMKEIKDDKRKSGKTITILRVLDLARLVRLVPIKGIGLDRLHKLFQECSSPEDSKTWIDELNNEQPKKLPYKEILKTIWKLQDEDPTEAVDFGEVKNELKNGKQINLSKSKLAALCNSMSSMVPKLIVVGGKGVELRQRPDKFIAAIHSALQDFPEEEQQNSIFKTPEKD